jgi:hypothetical protein
MDGPVVGKARGQVAESTEPEPEPELELLVVVE